MAAGDTCAADTVDVVCHEMDSVVRSHCFHKIGEACWPINMMNLQYVVVINYYQTVGLTLLKFCSQITWYYVTRRGSVVRCQASVIVVGEGGKEKA